MGRDAFGNARAPPVAQRGWEGEAAMEVRSLDTQVSQVFGPKVESGPAGAWSAPGHQYVLVLPASGLGAGRFQFVLRIRGSNATAWEDARSLVLSLRAN